MSLVDNGDVAVPDAPAPLADPASPPPFTYSWDFSYGLGPWTTWLPPAVISEPGGEIEQFTRLHAPGPLDGNHLDGIGSLWLVAHLSTPTLGSPGSLNLKDAEFEMTVRGTDFEANGGKLAIWICRYVPETGLTENFYVGLQVTNWANTGGDMAGQVTDEWNTITLKISDDPADWTYAGNNQSAEGDVADRYVPFDLDQTLSNVNATLHLVILNDDADNAPSGFLDLSNITVRTQTPATPDGASGANPEIHYGLEDQVATGVLTGVDSVDMTQAVFTLIDGSAANGVATVDPETGAFTFTPPADWFGPTDSAGYATFRYTVSDGVNTSAPITVVVYIGGTNDAPELTTRDESAHIAAGQPFDFSLFKGKDIDGDALTFKLVDGSVVGGALELDARTGRYTFTPTPGFTGEASFRYVLSDGHVDTVEKTVALTVHAAGDPPVVLTFDQAVDFLIAGDLEQWQYWVVRLADSDPNAAYHYATWANDGLFGVTRDWTVARQYFEAAAGASPDVNLRLATLYVAGQGGDRDYVGARALLEALPNDATAILRLAILNDLGFGGPVDKALAVEGYVQAAKMGSAEAAYNLGRRYLSGEGVAASPEDAYFWLGVALKFNAQPNAPAYRNLWAFNMSQAAQSLTPEQVAALNTAIAAWDPGEAVLVNDAPVFTGDETVGPPPVDGGPVTGVLADASDADGDGLVFLLVDGSAVNGTVTIDPETGAFAFVSTPGFTGTAAFSYVVSDGQASTPPRTVSFPVEASIAATPDAAGTAENVTLTVGAAAGLLANDSAAPGNTIAVTAVNGQAASIGQPVTGAWGVLVVQADGSYVFTPSAAALTLLQGQTASDSFTYTITDSDGVSLSTSLTITVNGQSGTVVTGSGVMIGSAFGDVLTGGAGYDVLIGLDGDDRLIGGVGLSDELYGGLGDDTYVVETLGDSIVELDGEGFDTVETTAIAYTLAANVEGLVFTGTGAFEGTGNAQNNVITGGAGADLLMGLAGDDILRGGPGAPNVLQGGQGDDIYVVSVAGDVLVELAGQGTDTVLTTLSAYTLASANVENLTYAGAGGFSGTGDAGANVITGGAGDDLLAGRGGLDTLIGGAGIDTASYETAAGAVDVRLNSGAARNDGDGSTDVLIGIENLTGSAFDDLLIGDTGGNLLRGGLGRDTLLGLDGDDVLDGGTGIANTLQGGRGDDLYVLSAVGDSVVEFEGEGYDTVQTALGSLKLAANVEVLTYVGTGSFFGQGNAGANIIRGGLNRDTLMGHGGDDILIGGDGAADEMYGGAGDDIYVVTGGGDTIVEYAGEGFDTVQTTLSTYTLRLNVEALTYVGAGDFTGTGTAEDNVITGGAGNDVLAGRGGNDTLVGGVGVDTASYANAAAGVDARLNTGVARNDGDGGADVLVGIENLTGSAFDDLLVGGAGANVLRGGSGRDTLLGMDGDDILDGGAGVANILQGGRGDDLYIVSAAGDSLVEFEGEGYDTVQTGLSAYKLAANIEALTYTGSTAFTGTGNASANVITGGAGNDVLTGGGGDDILNGGAGADMALLTGVKDDYLIEQIDGGWRITDRVAGRDGVDLLYGMETVRFGDGQILSSTPSTSSPLAVLDKSEGPQVQPDLFDEGQLDVGRFDLLDTGARWVALGGSGTMAVLDEAGVIHAVQGWDPLF